MVDQKFRLGSASSFPDLLSIRGCGACGDDDCSNKNLCYNDHTNIKKLHKRKCKKYFCSCKRHTISVIDINDSKKLYWFNCKNIEDKVNQSGDGYYFKLLNIINDALSTWAHRYIDGLSNAKKDIMFKINASSKKNMKLLKESCYCHYHPHITADDCNAEFLKKVVSFDPDIRITNGNSGFGKKVALILLFSLLKNQIKKRNKIYYYHLQAFVFNL